MVKNYLKTSLRSLWKNKSFSFLNIFGLSVGIGAALLLVTYVRYEMSFDKFYKNGDRLYRVYQKSQYKGRERTGLTSSGLLGPAIEASIPEVEATGRSHEVGNPIIKLGTNKFKEPNLKYADTGLLDILEIEFVEGDKSSALEEPNSIVLAQTLAEKLAGTGADILGSDIYIQDRLMKVTGVIADLPANSHFIASGFISISSMGAFSWDLVGHHTYVRLSSKDQQKAANSKLASIVEEFVMPTLPDNYAMQMSLYPVDQIYLSQDEGQEGKGDKNSVISFALISIFLITIACINYMNLATASAARRAKEIGLRKVIGATKGQLVRQFLTESIIISLISVLLGGFIAEMSSAFFQGLSGKYIETQLMSNGRTLLFLILFGFSIGTLTGIYPAFLLSSFKPLNVIKKVANGSKANRNFRRVLVSLQFIISTGLIISTLIVYKQIDYLDNKNLGYNEENLLSIQLRNSETAEILKEELLDIPGVTSIASTNLLPTSGDAGAPFEMVQDNGEILKSGVSFISVDHDFLTTMEMSVLMGRNFSREFSDHNSVIINQTLADKSGWKNPIGKKLIKGRDENGIPINQYTVVGVVKDFNMLSLYSPIKPTALFLRPNFNYFGQYLLVRFETNNTEDMLKSMREIYESVDAEYPFTSLFVDDYLMRNYSQEIQRGQLYFSFSLITIVVACLGLFGLSALILQQKAKEISIRKVLGASVSNIVRLISKEFVLIIVLSTIVSTPIAYHFMLEWLNSFEYRTEITWIPFLLAGAMTLTASLLTITFESLRTARTNPSDILSCD